MFKTTVEVEGMMCGMCESHVNDAIRKELNPKSVKSSHKDKITEIISNEEPDEEKIRKAIADTGYEVKGIRTEPYEKKKGFLGFLSEK